LGCDQFIIENVYLADIFPKEENEQRLLTLNFKKKWHKNRVLPYLLKSMHLLKIIFVSFIKNQYFCAIFVPFIKINIFNNIKYSIFVPFFFNLKSK
jgi:hypothetical protein